ncbi:MAG TPA: 4Fe-4S dicluster domain-containing protein [Ilumatobacteraceae bacterium]|jgi:2-oxoglutarate ferredoxin oxidoreductase subunit delta
MAKTVGTVTIAAQLCKGCDLCVVVCPEHVLAMTEAINDKGWPVVALVAEGCTGCTLCADVCPDGVFAVYREERSVGGGRR